MQLYTMFLGLVMPDVLKSFWHALTTVLTLFESQYTGRKRSLLQVPLWHGLIQCDPHARRQFMTLLLGMYEYFFFRVRTGVYLLYRRLQTSVLLVFWIDKAWQLIDYYARALDFLFTDDGSQSSTKVLFSVIGEILKLGIVVRVRSGILFEILWESSRTLLFNSCCKELPRPDLLHKYPQSGCHNE